jgi:CubicO group peptidase (beta-lactamase class C family)
MTSSRSSRRAVLGMLGAAPLAAGGLLAVPATAEARAGSAGHNPVPPELLPGGTLDKLIAQRAAADQYSGTVLLLHDGHPVLSRSYGMADKQLSIGNGPETIFALGSITKLFTGIAIAQLVQQGKVAYHEKLGAYLDGFPAEVAGTVTVHQLLTHTAGMGDVYRDSGDIMHTWSSEEEVITRLLGLVREAPLGFPPGTGHTYSNNGYIVLGYIVAAASGQTYYDYVRQHIFRPAGMTSSDFYTRDQWRGDRRIAHPYAPPRSGGARVDNVDREMFIGNGAANSHSTVADLAAFVKALTCDKLLDAQQGWLVTSPKFPVPPLPPQPGKPPQSLFAGYGPSATLVSNHWCIGHNGGSTNGISTNLEWFPGTGYVAVNLGNYEVGGGLTIDSEIRRLITTA